MTLQQTIDAAVRGLGYELVELERSAGGLLRVTIDWPWAPGADERLVAVDDCERVTRQLQYVLEVEAVAGSAREGIEACRLHQPDILLLDLALPDRNGLAVARALAKSHPSSRTIIVSG